jgi:hypothetical protein
MARASACKSWARSRAKAAVTGGAVAAPLEEEAGGEARGESWMERSGEGGAEVEAARTRERRRGARLGDEGLEKQTAAAAEEVVVVAAMAGESIAGKGMWKLVKLGKSRGATAPGVATFLVVSWLIWGGI